MSIFRKRFIPQTLPPEVIPEPVMTLTRFRQYIMFVLRQEYIKPAQGMQNWIHVKPGDKVRLEFIEWKKVFLVKIIADWDDASFDRNRERWEKENAREDEVRKEDPVCR